MSFVFQIVIMIIGIVISVLIGRLLSQNGKILKRMDEGFKMLGEKMDEGFRTLGEMMNQGFKTLGEKMDEGFRRNDQGFKLIALLILAETPEEKKSIAKKLLGEE